MICSFLAGLRSTIRYDPSQPEHSCLIAGEAAPLGAYAVPIFVMLCAALFSFFMPPTFSKIAAPLDQTRRE
jgi:hypothetical protein